jgi:hypothetical protein
VERHRFTSRLVAAVVTFAIAGAGALACGAFRGTDASADDADAAHDASAEAATDATRAAAGDATTDAKADGHASITDGSVDTGVDAPPGDANRTGYWFVTSKVFPTGTPFPGGFASLADADALCGVVAEGAGQRYLRGRKWFAFLGADGVDPKDRMAPGAFAQYERTDGQVLGSLDAMLNANNVGLPFAPSIDENGFDTGAGVDVWTGSHSGGTADNSCNSWTSNDMGAQAMTGISGAVNSNWVHNGNLACNAQRALYCVEQR